MLTALTLTKQGAQKKAQYIALISALFIFFGLVSSLFLYFKNTYYQQVKVDTQNAVVMVDQLFDQTETVAKNNWPLLEHPCQDVEQDLRISGLTFVAIRSINLVKNNTVYCSSILSNFSQPIDPEQNTITLTAGSAAVADIPIINYLYLIDKKGIAITMYADYITTKLIQNRTRDNNGDYLLAIGNNWLLNGKMGSGQWDNPYLFSYMVASKKYPFSILHGHTRNDFYKAIQSHSFNIFLILVFSVSIGILIRWIAYLHLRKKSTTLLARALRANEIEPYVQPIVNANDGNWIAVEVLARWKNPLSNKYISPAVFIPIAERSHLIIPMTSQLMQKVADTLVLIEADLPDHFKVAFNICAMNCTNLTLLEDCTHFLNRFTTNKIKLVLELTERDFIEWNDFTADLFDQLKKINVEFVLDDFGTRHSNLSYFEKFRIDYFKIDTTFTSKIETSPITRKLVDNILDLAIKLNMPIVVEGIETKAQSQYFITRGIYQQQGYLFAKPMSLEHFKKAYTLTNSS